ncbi:EamA family transporter [Paractinoplanes maris]|uniref:EamA family transporter n=1 Tax=Paractinoplanes maris TaxID=1734446 RepID=UPI0020202508|nr:EamA family transporter [Actinoplanes maris]
MTFAALAAAAWGISDFLAGLLARRIPVLTILIGSKIAAMLLAMVVVLARGVPLPDDPRLWLGVVAGMVGLPAMGLLYRAMRDGSLVVVAPVAAIAALVPVGWGLVHGERLGVVAALGVVVGLIGVTMASWPVAAQGRMRVSAQVCALAAAIGLGVYFVLLHEASATDPVWATALARMTGGVSAVLLMIAVSHRLPRPPRDVAEPTSATGSEEPCPQVGFRPQATLRPPASWYLGLRIAVPVFLIGATDALADASFIVAASRTLAPAAVVASLYPAVTLLLNRSLLRERLHTVHLYGVLAALFAVACLAR